MQRMFSLTFIVTRKLSSKGPIDPGNPIWNRYLRTQAIYHCRQNLRQKGNSPWALAWENSRHLATLQLVPPTSPPLQMTSEKGAQKFHTDDASLPSASDWLNQISHAARPIRSPMQIWVVTRHQYGNSALVSQTLVGGETSRSAAKCRLFSQATGHWVSSRVFGIAYFPTNQKRGFQNKYFWNSVLAPVILI